MVRVLLPVIAAGLVLTGAASGERSASAEVEEVVSVAPPAAPVEFVGAAPSPEHFWAPGYYGYHPGVGHVWHGGEWLRRRPGYAWSQPGWHRWGRGWGFHRGGWGRGGRW
jgi:hypothetical protein